MKKETKDIIFTIIGVVLLGALFGWIFYTCLTSPDPFYEVVESNGRTPAYNRMHNIDID